MNDQVNDLQMYVNENVIVSLDLDRRRQSKNGAWFTEAGSRSKRSDEWDTVGDKIIHRN